MSNTKSGVKYDARDVAIKKVSIPNLIMRGYTAFGRWNMSLTFSNVGDDGCRIREKVCISSDLRATLIDGDISDDLWYSTKHLKVIIKTRDAVWKFGPPDVAAGLDQFKTSSIEMR